MEPEDQGIYEFDARRAWLSESDQDPTHWGTISLLTCLKALLTFSTITDSDDPLREIRLDAEHRERMIASIVDELDHRGLDGDAFVRYGLGPSIAGGALGFVIVGALLPGAVEKDSPGMLEQVAGWREVFTSEELPLGVVDITPESLQDPEFLRAMGRWLNGAVGGLAKVKAWFLDASLADLSSLQAPRRADVEAAPALTADAKDLIRIYRWLVDRFTNTYIDDWHIESLHLELQWLEGTANPGCSIEIMDERKVNPTSLNAVIARLAASKLPQRRQPAGSADAVQSLAHKVDPHARAYLAEGRRREAAALYEFVTKEDPGDAWALNNLGFCQIPDSPERALANLERAARLGYRPSIINLYNRICCLMALGRDRLAARLAREFVDSHPRHQHVSAILWVPQGIGEWQLKNEADAAEEILAINQGLSHQRRRSAAHTVGLADSDEEPS